MDTLSLIFSIIIILLCVVLPFVICLFAMISIHRRTGNWYVENVKALNKKDLSSFATRNMIYPGLILALFLLPTIAYLIFRPSYVDPSWLCILIAGVMIALLAFQGFQYIWLYYRNRNK